MTTKDRDAEIGAALGRNIGRFMEDGPGLRYGTETWVEARDRKRRRVLIGGLGGMGVGSMWMCPSAKYGYEPEEEYAGALGFADAPEQDSFGDFGTGDPR